MPGKKGNQVIMIVIRDSEEETILNRHLEFHIRGLKVIAADCCRKAREMAIQNSFDAFVIDSELPDCKGYELAEDLWASTGKESVVLTRTSESSSPARDYLLGILQKPYSASALVHLVCRGLGVSNDNR